MNLATGNERQVGRIVSVTNYRIMVLLDAEIRSQIRAYPHRLTIITQIGGYLVFPVSPGESAVGIIVGAAEDEAIEPDTEAGMTLQLTRLRRTLKLNLLGQLLENSRFVTGVSTYPTLDTPALLPTETELKAILEYTPRPEKAAVDSVLSVGVSPIYARQDVTVSYNDLLGRPLAVIGNTGSGKSFSVASLVERGKELSSKSKFIVLDINGEYCSAFCNIKELKKELNRAYINNASTFLLPLWVFNLSEAIAFFEAAQASQVPILERVITFVREEAVDPEPSKNLRKLLRTTDHCSDLVQNLSLYAQEVQGMAVADNVAEILLHLREYSSSLPDLIAKVKGISLPDNVAQLDKHVTEITAAGLKTKEQYAAMRKAKTWDDFSRLPQKIASAIIKFVETMEPSYQLLRQDIRFIRLKRTSSREGPLSSA